MIEKDTGRGALPSEIRSEMDIVLEAMNHLIKNLNILKESSQISPDVKEKSEFQVTNVCHAHILENIIIPYSKSSFKTSFKLNEPVELRNKEIFDYDVFICHSSKDNESVNIIINDFMRNNITYWVDAEQIKFGDRVTQRIEDGLKRSKCLMPCLSRNLVNSGWTRAEYCSILNAEFSGNSNL